MALKVNSVFLILGLFLFKVGIIDNLRHMPQGRSIASEKPLKPIR